MSLRGRMTLLAGGIVAIAMLSAPALAVAGPLKPKPIGGLDCNGYSPLQRTLHLSAACTDVRGFSNEWTPNTWDGHFYDNNHYVGHDEPDMVFLSNKPGSGDNVTWTETLPRDPAAAATASNPGSDVSHWYELTVAPWFSMMMCDPNSYPQSSCTPESDANAPTCVGNNITNCNPGGGSAFMEMQLYPPGFPPWVDSTSCDDSHWCAALTIDSLECTLGFQNCNAGCTEPINAAWIQRDGIPTGPPNPQQTDLASATPNSQTLLMNPGDSITIHMFDAPAPGGGDAFKVVIHDASTGQTGYMQASAANGFATTSISDCSGTPFNFQPEYSTASPQNNSPWGADTGNILTQFEIGHFTPCTNVTKASSIALAPGISDTYYNNCHGPYEHGQENNTLEPTDAFCYPAGYTHGVLNTAPDLSTGCDDYLAGGDLDFDGTPYWPEWPTRASATARLPGSFVQQLPTSVGSQYSQYYVQTDTALSEATCTSTTLSGCAIPPPQAPGRFYPYFSRVSSDRTCTLEFGNVSSGPGVNDLGGDAQYGSNQAATLGYPQFVGPTLSNSCRGGRHG